MKPAIALIACAATCACGGEREVDARNASVEQVANQVRAATADDQFVRPGKWQSKVTIEQLEMPGMPPQLAEQMKSAMARHQERTSESCLTPEQVKRPSEDFFAGKDNDCRYDHFTMGAGKIDARMRCAAVGGASQVMEMTGTYSPESYSMRMATHTEGAGGNGMVMRLRTESTRIGECDRESTRAAETGG